MDANTLMRIATENTYSAFGLSKEAAFGSIASLARRGAGALAGKDFGQFTSNAVRLGGGAAWGLAGAAGGALANSVTADPQQRGSAALKGALAGGLAGVGLGAGAAHAGMRYAPTQMIDAIHSANNASGGHLLRRLSTARDALLNFSRG